MNKLTPAQKLLADELTPLQRMFVNGIIEGKTQREAYVAAGGTAKSSNAQDVSASRMLSLAKVKAYYDDILNDMASKAICDREEILSMYSEDARTSISKSDRHRALKGLRDMLGMDADKKYKVTHDAPDEVKEVIRHIVNHQKPAEG
jgi:phage terminase small subunit